MYEATNGRRCSIEGCDRLARRNTAEWCHLHYARWYKHGDPHYQRVRTPKPCKIEGCNRVAVSWSLCSKHYIQWYKHGDPLRHDKRRDAGWLSTDGYVKVMRPGHPLASQNGSVGAHRIVLYEKIGPGEHPCHWCGRIVSWDKTYPVDRDALVTDHLDNDRANNDPANVVQSCNPCNVRRGLARRWAKVAS